MHYPESPKVTTDPSKRICISVKTINLCIYKFQCLVSQGNPDIMDVNLMNSFSTLKAGNNLFKIDLLFKGDRLTFRLVVNRVIQKLKYILL